MPFKKGQSGNIQGRKIGTKNVKNLHFREFMQNIVNENINYFNTNKNLSINERMLLIKILMPYVQPRLSSVLLQDETSEVFKTINVNIIKPNDN